ncbi:hypothetical protein ACFL0M_14685 [Thermodesulfobacteriota bacterium]
MKEINRVWAKLKKGNTFRTPDNLRGTNFSIALIQADRILIDPQKIFIHRKAFIAALDYLFSNKNNVINKCEIKSNNDSEKAGPLCRASRKENHNIRCINYIIPILKANKLIDYSSDRPNKVWLNTTVQKP